MRRALMTAAAVLVLATPLAAQRYEQVQPQPADRNIDRDRDGIPDHRDGHDNRTDRPGWERERDRDRPAWDQNRGGDRPAWEQSRERGEGRDGRGGGGNRGDNDRDGRGNRGDNDRDGRGGDRDNDQRRAERALNTDIETALQRRGYSVGVQDGRMDTDSRAAIRAYERDAGLPITGQPSRQLLNHIETNRVQAGRGRPDVTPGAVIDNLLGGQRR